MASNKVWSSYLVVLGCGQVGRALLEMVNAGKVSCSRNNKLVRRRICGWERTQPYPLQYWKKTHSKACACRVCGAFVFDFVLWSVLYQSIDLSL